MLGCNRDILVQIFSAYVLYFFLYQNIDNKKVIVNEIKHELKIIIIVECVNRII